VGIFVMPAVMAARRVVAAPPVDLWFDFVFTERMEQSPVPYYAYLSNTETIPENCVLYLSDNNGQAKWIDFWWIKTGNMRIRAGNNDMGTIDNPYVAFNTGDTLAFDINSLMSAMGDSVLDVSLRLNSETGPVVGELYQEIQKSPACYLTTTCVHRYGLADDGPELTAMRKLRDHYIEQPGYRELIDEYYRLSPQIIQSIEQSGARDGYYQAIYESVTVVREFVERGEWGLAHDEYLAMYYALVREMVSE